MLILDETDRMFDMGFYEQLEAIFNAVPKDKQTLMFSATFPKEIEQMATNHLIDPVKVFVQNNEEANVVADNLVQEEVRLKKYAIVMEGFMDVIRASTIGIKNTVALMGTALTEEQISLLKKLSNTIYLCLDGDTPGLTANLHNGELLEKAGLEVKVIYLKDDEDPDTYILKNGKEKFEELIENALNYSDYRIERLRNNVDFSSDADVAKYVNEVLKETALIKDNIRQEIILKKLAIETYLSYNTLDKKLSELKGNKKEEKVEEVRKEKKLDKYTRASLEFIYYMLNNEEVIHIFDSKKLYFINSSLRALAGEISYYYHNYGNIVIADFYTYLNDKKELLASFEEVINLNLNEEVTMDTLKDYAKVISDYNVRQEIKRLEEKLKSEPDELEKAKISESIRKLRIWGEEND
jgi:DNA primase